MTRAIGSLFFGLVACSSLASSPTVTQIPSDLSGMANEVIQTLDAMAGTIGSSQQQDLSMAWSDLDSDLRSLVNEAVSRPGSVRLDGFGDRVEGFKTRFHTHDDVAAIGAQWDLLLASLDSLHSQLVLLAGS